MQKKKIAAHHQEKALKLPPAVIDAREDLKKKNNKCFFTMKNLTESKDLHLSDALPKMWASLEDAEKKRHRIQHLKYNSWVQHFIIYTDYYSNIPSHYYQNKKQRKKLFENIDIRHTC